MSSVPSSAVRDSAQPRVPSRVAPATGRVPLWRRVATPSGVHYAVLVVGFIVLLAASRTQGINWDDWAFLYPGPLDIWAPHNEHWSTVPILYFLFVRSTFGLEHFTPLVLPDLIAHLAIAHLSWRVVKRVGVAPWIATALSVLVVFLGVGWENILWAFQMGFIGAVALGLLSIVLLTGHRFGPWHVAAVAVISVFSLMFSGTSLPALLAVAIVALVQQGWKRTVIMIGPSAVVFCVWYSLAGRLHSDYGHAGGLRELVLGIPVYTAAVLGGGPARAFPLFPVLGVAAMLALGCYIVWSLFRITKERMPSYALLAAAVAFALMTGVGRVGLGLGSAVASRYAYLVIVFLLPLIGSALTDLARRVDRTRIRFGTALSVVLVLLLAGYNSVLLKEGFDTRGAQIALAKGERYAALSIVEKDPGLYPDFIGFDGTGSPGVTVGMLKQYAADGWLTPHSFTAMQAKDVEISLELADDAAQTPPLSGDVCTNIPADGKFRALPRDAPAFLNYPAQVAGQPQPQFKLRVGHGARAGSPTTAVAGGWTRLAPRIANDFEIATSVPGIRLCVPAQ